jgi:hypothetical protein
VGVDENGGRLIYNFNVTNEKGSEWVTESRMARNDRGCHSCGHSHHLDWCSVASESRLELIHILTSTIVVLIQNMYSSTLMKNYNMYGRD